MHIKNEIPTVFFETIVNINSHQNSNKYYFILNTIMYR